MVEVHSQTANVTITKSRSGPVYAGTEFVLTADISLSGVNGDISLDITWRRGNDVIASDTHTTVSAVSGSGDSYTASLTYSPITISDSGQITVNVSPSDESTHRNIVTMTNTVMVTVEGGYTVATIIPLLLRLHLSYIYRSPSTCCEYRRSSRDLS